MGLIGAGRMGTPIIGHLVRKGFTTLASDLDPAREAPVVERGARWVAGTAELAAQAT